MQLCEKLLGVILRIQIGREAQTVHVKLASEEVARKEDTLVVDGYQWYAVPKVE